MVSMGPYSEDIIYMPPLVARSLSWVCKNSCLSFPVTINQAQGQTIDNMDIRMEEDRIIHTDFFAEIIPASQERKLN